MSKTNIDKAARVLLKYIKIDVADDHIKVSNEAEDDGHAMQKAVADALECGVNAYNALDISIVKYQAVLDELVAELKRYPDRNILWVSFHLNQITCPLCWLFFDDNCFHCPIANYTGLPFCNETPYRNLIESCTEKMLLRSLRAEIKFLKEVKQYANSVPQE